MVVLFKKEKKLFSLYIIDYTFYLVWLFISIILAYQGGWELDESVEEAASRESLEEAGVRGNVEVSEFCHFLEYLISIAFESKFIFFLDITVLLLNELT